jgi:hypothetical protein
MSLTELLPALQALSRADRLRLLQLLVDGLAREEGIPQLEADKSYPVWTPYQAQDAAVTLMDTLNRDRGLT